MFVVLINIFIVVYEFKEAWIAWNFKETYILMYSVTSTDLVYPILFNDVFKSNIIIVVENDLLVTKKYLLDLMD